MMIALERREADATTVIVSSLLSQFARLLQDKQVNVLVQNSIERNPAFPDVPTPADLARSSDDKEIMKLFAISSDIGRTIIAPPGTPAEHVALLRRAFMETMAI